MKKIIKGMILVILILIGVFAISGCKKNNNEKNEARVENNILINEEENTTKNNNIVEENSTKNSETSEKGNLYDEINKKIRETLKERRFLAKNNIDESDIQNIKFIKLDVKNNPQYLISVVYQKEEEPGEESLFLVNYKNNQVVFSKQSEEKYVGDIYIDDSKNIIKLTQVRRGMQKDIFIKIENGEFNTVDTITGPASDEYEDSVVYTKNGENVTKEEYQKTESKYNQYKFYAFEDRAIDFNDENINKYVK